MTVTHTPSRPVAAPAPRPVVGLPARAVVALIGVYRRFISPALPPSCRFTPSCSAYTAEAVSRFGVVRGVWLGLCRLAKCHPFHPGGHDPVPSHVGRTGRPSRPAAVAAVEADGIDQADEVEGSKGS